MRRVLLAFVTALVTAAPAAANPRPFPFTYHYATSAEGALELEQYLDFVPTRVSKEGPSGTEAVTSARMNLETEFELGLTHQLELGWYFVFQQAAGVVVQPLTFKGVKQRLRYRFSDAGDWPVDTGLYLEFGEYHNELEIEEKLLLEKRFGAWRVATNLWFEHEYLFQTPEWAHIYNPPLSAGLYTKMDDLSEQLQVDGNLGRVWIRTLIGIGL